MASTILGIDLGSYAVKVARLDQSFRNLSLVHIDEVKVPPPVRISAPERSAERLRATRNQDSTADSGEDSLVTEVEPEPDDDDSEPEPLLSRQMRALRQLLSAQRGRTESAAVGLADGVTLRLIDMPLSDPKKVQAALPFELAGQLMSDLEDQVVDQTPAQTATVRPGGDASSLWLAACAEKAAVQATIAALSGLSLEPRLVGAAALATATVLSARALPQTQQSGPNLAPPEWPVWVLDLGHRHTHVVAVTPHPNRPGQVVAQFARTIARGGEQLTQAVVKALGVGIGIAEELKHQIGLVGSGDMRVKTALRDALKPLVRDLRQTLAAYSARYGEGPRALLLCGGTSHLHGIEEYLQGELDISTQALLPPAGAPWLRQGARELAAISMSGVTNLDDATRTHVSHTQLVRLWPTGCAAVGLALAISGVTPQVNFRKGEMAYRSDLALLREKAPLIAGFTAAILLCVAGWAWATLKVLDREHERLRQQLSSETNTLFGKEINDGHQVQAELNSALGSDKGEKTIPRVSALDLLEDFSRSAPDKNAAGPARLEVADLSIRPKKIDLKATCGSAQYVDDLAEALKKLPCIKSVQKGKVLTVRNNGPDGKPVEVKQFSLEIENTCL